MDHGLDHKTRKYDFMAVDIRNIANRNGIYYFRCRIPSNLTNGQYREVKISLNTRCFDAHLFEIVENKKMVGVRGFEPPASASRTQRSSQTEPHPDLIGLTGFPVLVYII